MESAKKRQDMILVRRLGEWEEFGNFVSQIVPYFRTKIAYFG